jgi:hypothetical protein
MLASAGNDRTVRLWETVTGEPRERFTGHSDQVLSLACAGDGRRLVSGGLDATALVWGLYPPPADGTTGRPALTGPTLEALWADLAAADAGPAYRAVSALVAGPERALPFLREHLHPASVEEGRKIARLIDDLDSDDFAAREQATEELGRLGETAALALRAALARRTSPELRRRGLRLLERLDGKPTPERLRQTRALEVLEQVGNTEARQILKGLADGAANAWLTEEAKAVLDRLSRRIPPAP